MTIECSSSAASVPVPAHAQGQGGSGRGNAGGASAGTFFSLLSGLGESPAPGAVPAIDGPFTSAILPGAGPGLRADQGTASDVSSQALLAQFLALGESSTPGAALALTDPLANAVRPGAGPGGSTDQGGALDATAQALLAQFLDLGGTAAQLRASAAGSGAAALAQTLPAASQGVAPPWGKGRAPGVSTAAEAASTATTWSGHGVAHRGLSTEQSMLSAAPVASTTTAAPDASAHGTHSAVRAALANTQGLVRWQQTQDPQGAAPDAPPGSVASVHGETQALESQSLLRPADSVALPGFVAALAASDSAAFGRERERAGAGPGRGRADLSHPSGTALPAMALAPGGVPANTTAAQGTPLESAVAEQVKYWVTNDIRNAEMKLDGLGSQPVQVSISLSGHEAQVVFRSDQAQTRELLGNAMGQLEQALRGEGLTLAGAWVGSSGQQGGPAGDPQQARAGQAAAPVTTERATAGVSSAASARRTRVTDGSVDLFV